MVGGEGGWAPQGAREGCSGRACVGAMADAGDANAAAQPSPRGAQPTGTREVLRRKSSAGAPRIQTWRVTLQTDRSDKAHCCKCKCEFAAKEARLESFRQGEEIGNKRARDRYFHVSRVDAVLPDMSNVVGAGALELEQKLKLGKGTSGAQQTTKRIASCLAHQSTTQTA